VQLRECGAQPLGVAVGVAVDATAGGVDRGVDHLGVGELGPLRTGQVEVGDTLQLQGAFVRPPLAADPVLLLLVDVGELPVVVELWQPHQLVGASVGPGPWMMKNQNEKTITTTATQAARIHSSAPRSWR
jgi:hypothetical protein